MVDVTNNHSANQTKLWPMWKTQLCRKIGKNSSEDNRKGK